MQGKPEVPAPSDGDKPCCTAGGLCRPIWDSRACWRPATWRLFESVSQPQGSCNRQPEGGRFEARDTQTLGLPQAQPSEGKEACWYPG